MQRPPLGSLRTHLCPLQSSPRASSDTPTSTLGHAPHPPQAGGADDLSSFLRTRTAPRRVLWGCRGQVFHPLVWMNSSLKTTSSTTWRHVQKHTLVLGSGCFLLEEPVCPVRSPLAESSRSSSRCVTCVRRVSGLHLDPGMHRPSSAP